MIANGHNYYVESSGAGVPILLLHGFTGDITIWQDVRRELESDYHVIAIDILGHGRSDKPSAIEAYHMGNVAVDIIRLLNKLELEKAHLLGYSMGGRLALYLATTYPERFYSLILESASPGLATEQERNERQDRDNALADKIESNGMAWFVNFWEGLSLWDSQKSLPQTALDAQRTQRLGNDPTGLANSLRGMGTGVQPSLWGNLSGLKLPIKLIAGEHDKKFIRINQEMAEQMPNADLKIISNAGHTVHLENRIAFINRVRQFLRTVDE
jgi:2-succinyl-6-hydroxy-2,4-cyclohexadiene-1-carboxylate synthase